MNENAQHECRKTIREEKKLQQKIHVHISNTIVRKNKSRLDIAHKCTKRHKEAQVQTEWQPEKNQYMDLKVRNDGML